MGEPSVSARRPWQYASLLQAFVPDADEQPPLPPATPDDESHWRHEARVAQEYLLRRLRLTHPALRRPRAPDPGRTLRELIDRQKRIGDDLKRLRALLRRFTEVKEATAELESAWNNTVAGYNLPPTDGFGTTAYQVIVEPSRFASLPERFAEFVRSLDEVVTCWKGSYDPRDTRAPVEVRSAPADVSASAAVFLDHGLRPEEAAMIQDLEGALRGKPQAGNWFRHPVAARKKWRAAFEAILRRSRPGEVWRDYRRRWAMDPEGVKEEVLARVHGVLEDLSKPPSLGPEQRRRSVVVFNTAGGSFFVVGSDLGTLDLMGQTAAAEFGAFCEIPRSALGLQWRRLIYRGGTGCTGLWLVPRSAAAEAQEEPWRYGVAVYDWITTSALTTV